MADRMTKKEREEQEALARSQVGAIREEDLSLMNQYLAMSLKIRKAKQEELGLQKEIKELGRKAVIDANKYSKVTTEVKKLEEELAERKKANSTTANKNLIKQIERELGAERKKQAALQRTAGGQLRAMEMEAKKKKDALITEKKLIADINKERGVGGRLANLFRTKEERQRQIDIARARAGGGANIPPGGGGTTAGAAGAGGGGGGKGAAAGILGVLGIAGLVAGIKAGLDKLSAPFKAIGGLIKSSVAAPLAQVSGLVSGGIGGGYGIGGGAISGAGATSLLGGLQDIISTIPVIGGLLGGLVGIFKGIVDLVLGIDQGITNFARNLGISKDRAAAIKNEFRGVAKASDNIVVNETRLMESQAELTKALGVRSQFTDSILENNIKLKEIAGLELETRKALAQTSITTGRNAEKLTKSILAQSKAFEFETGVAFEFKDVLTQASKQAGVLGLTFTKYPEKLTKSLMVTKAMGFEMKQLDGIASSFLDFETSLSKEMEAQVLTGKELNLTRAREAALNNDLVTLAKEITTQVGSSAEFLKMDRFEQESIAEAVGMTRDGLAEVLKQQDYYGKLGATNLKQAQEELRILKQRGLTQAEISKKIGEDAYNYITQTSTAERLTETMNRIKTIFIEFIEKSGILDFITNPQKIQGFVTGLINRLAGAVQMIGDIVASILDLIGNVAGFFGGNANKFKGLASSVRAGTAGFAGGLRGAANTIGGMNFGEAAPSIGTTVEQGTKQQNVNVGGATKVTGKETGSVNGTRNTGDVYLDGQKVGYIILGNNANQLYGLDKA